MKDALVTSLLPAFFLEPRSQLEAAADLWAHAPILFGIGAELNPVKRMLRVLKWFVSAWHLRPKGVCWPFMPVVGEVFRASWRHVDGSTSVMVAEMVRDQPATFCTFVENAEQELRLHLCITPRWTVGWNSCALHLDGEGTLSVGGRSRDDDDDSAETYTFTLPSLCARSVLVGDLRMEVAGTCRIMCTNTGLCADVTFVPSKRLCGASSNRVRGWVGRELSSPSSSSSSPPATAMYHIDGKFSERVWLQRLSDRSRLLLFDVEQEPISRILVQPRGEQAAGESGRVWQRVSAALRRHDYGSAAVECAAVRAAAGAVATPPSPRWFRMEARGGTSSSSVGGSAWRYAGGCSLQNARDAAAADAVADAVAHSAADCSTA